MREKLMRVMEFVNSDTPLSQNAADPQSYWLWIRRGGIRSTSSGGLGDAGEVQRIHQAHVA